MNSEFWMDGKKNNSFKMRPNEFLNSSNDYSYKASLNIEIEETFVPTLMRSIENDTISEKNSQFSKKSLFAGYRDTSSLCYQFLDIVDAFKAPSKVCDMITNFVSSCSDTLDTYSDLRPTDKRWLENEKNTWRLLYALYENRLHYVNEEMNLCPENDLDVMKNYFQNNESIRECQLVVDWLEECSASRTDDRECPKLSHFMDKTIAWENTLHQLQISSIPYSSSRALVTAMDPDAPQRQKRQLHDLDIEDEARLLEQVFTEIRCGRLHKALEICNLCGHKWRATILQGWMLFNDPNYKNDNSESVISAFGNPNRDIWKMCAWRLTEESTCSSMWKAIIGIFCGNLSALLPFCRSWEDLLWAYLKVYIDVRVEEEIRNVGLKTCVQLPDQYWDFKYNIDEIFEELAGYKENTIRIESSTPERVIQRMIITNRIPELINILAEWCSSETASVHLVRFAAHIIICFRNLALLYDNSQVEEILLAYVKVLIKSGDAKLVAYYTAMLPEKLQIEYYSQFLENISDENERIKCLEIAETCGLPIDSITKYVVQTIRGKTEESGDTVDLMSGISKQDDEKISALDLIMHYSHQRDEALWETNALIRHFLAQRNIQAANYAFCKIPDNSVEVILQKLSIDEKELQSNPELVPDKTFAAIREYFCYKVYLNAEIRFADWFQSFHKMEPSRPPQPPENSQFAQKVSYEQDLNLYEQEHRKWKASLEEQTKLVKSHLYNMLLFPDGGWLIENRYFEDEGRMNQMASLRKLYIPKITITLHTVLHSLQMYDECLKLADIITSENYEIYKVYSAQDLAEILKKICDSSVMFLKNGKDSFGLQVTL